jgi:hypothetical protein
MLPLHNPIELRLNAARTLLSAQLVHILIHVGLHPMVTLNAGRATVEKQIADFAVCIGV